MVAQKKVILAWPTSRLYQFTFLNIWFQGEISLSSEEIMSPDKWNDATSHWETLKSSPKNPDGHLSMKKPSLHCISPLKNRNNAIKGIWHTVWKFEIFLFLKFFPWINLVEFRMPYNWKFLQWSNWRFSNLVSILKVIKSKIWVVGNVHISTLCDILDILKNMLSFLQLSMTN